MRYHQYFPFSPLSKSSLDWLSQGLIFLAINTYWWAVWCLHSTLPCLLWLFLRSSSESWCIIILFGLSSWFYARTKLILLSKALKCTNEVEDSYPVVIDSVSDIAYIPLCQQPPLPHVTFPSVVTRQTSNSSMEVVGRAFVPRCRSRRSRASRGLSDLPTTDLRHFLQSPLHIVVNQQFRCAFGYFELPQLLALDDPVSRSTGQTEIGSGSLRRAKSHPMPNYLQGMLTRIRGSSASRIFM